MTVQEPRVKSREQQITEHLARWNKAMNSISPPNVELAEQSISELYRIAGKKEPDTIVWCQSPFQMAVLPNLVTNIIQSEEWNRLVLQMKDAGEPSTRQWHEEWDKQWALLEEGPLRGAASKLFNFSSFTLVGPATQKTALLRLKHVMSDILVAGKLLPGSLKYQPLIPILSAFDGASKEKHKKQWTQVAPIDLGMLKTFIVTNNQIERAAGIKLSLNALSISSLVFEIDPRLVTKLLPATEPLLASKVSAERAAQSAEVKQRCRDFEAECFGMMLWYHNMFPAPQRPEANIDTSKFSRESWLKNTSAIVSEVSRVHKNISEDVKAHPDLANRASVSLPYAAPWLPFALACRMLDPDIFTDDLNRKIDCIAYLSHAALSYAFCENICFVCPKPFSMLTNERGRPHSAEGPAMQWEDRLQIFAWRGVIIDPKWIEKREEITCKQINDQTNAELRRVLIELYGESRYLVDSNAKVINESRFGTLYNLPIPGDEALVMVRVKNSTPEPDGTYKHYFLRVPPDTTSARAAVAWTFGLAESEYQPDLQS